MDSFPTKKPKEEVTGISRSGRVRKKSSKLMDFESPDEIEKTFSRRQSSTAASSTTSSTPGTTVSRKSNMDNHGVQPPQRANKSQKFDEAYGRNDFDYGNDLEGSDSDYDGTSDYELPNQMNESSMDSMDSGSDYEPDDGTGFRRLDIDTSSASSKRRLVIKDGRIIKQDVTPTSMRFGGGRSVTGGGGGGGGVSSGSTGRTNMFATAGRVQQRNMNTGTSSATSSSSSSLTSKMDNSIPSHHSIVSAFGAAATANFDAGLDNASPASSPKHGSVSGAKDVSLFRVNGIKPIDVAAHLKLLGESLTIIGARLKEHEGQIAVSGSLSVLLDSLLCALGPLICLTQQIPELRDNCCSVDELANTLDNVAFIMPGL